jgi:hypothetical protein
VAVIEGHDIGGTCVNRGCVPSKALLAASGRVREMKNAMHLKSMGIQVGRGPRPAAVPAPWPVRRQGRTGVASIHPPLRIAGAARRVARVQAVWQLCVKGEGGLKQQQEQGQQQPDRATLLWGAAGRVR